MDLIFEIAHNIWDGAQNLVIFVCIILALVIIVLFKNQLYTFNESLRELKLYGIEFNYFRYIALKVEMRWQNVPSRFIFGQYARIREGGHGADINTLLNSYRVITSAIEKKLSLYHKRNISESLTLFRLGSHYIIVGEINNIFNIRKLNNLNTSNIVLTQIQKKADILKLNDINELLKNKIHDVLTLFKHYPISLSDVNKNSNNTKERELIIVDVIGDLRNQLRSKNVYLLDELTVSRTGKNDKLLKKIRKKVKKNEDLLHKENTYVKIFLDRIIFENIISSFIKSQEAGLELKLNEIGSYFGMEGDYERMVNILIKAKQFDFRGGLKEIEKYLYVDYNIEDTISNLIRARKVNEYISLKDLEKHISLGGDVVVFVNSIIKAHYGEIPATPEQLNRFFSRGGDVHKLVIALIKLKKEGIDISFEDLSDLQLEGGNVEQIIDDIIRANHVDIEINLNNVKSYLSQDIQSHELLDVMIKNTISGLNITIEDLKKLARINADLDVFYKSMNINIKSKLGIKKEKLIQLQTAGADMMSYVKAVQINHDNNLNINPLEFESDLLEKRNVLPVLFSVMRTKTLTPPLSYSFGILLDRFGNDITEVVNWAINPQVITIEFDHIIAKNGFSIKPTINVVVRGKIYQYLKGARDEVLKVRVNEAFIKEIELMETHKDVLKTLEKISNRVLKRLNAEMTADSYDNKITSLEVKEINEREAKFNESSAYEILGVSVQNIEIDTEILAQLERDQAELEHIISAGKSHERTTLAIAQVSETKAKLIESEAELKRGMARAFSKGYMQSTNEYLKRQIFNEESSDLRYAHSQHNHPEDNEEDSKVHGNDDNENKENESKH